MFTSGNTSPCHHSLHLFVKTDESQQAGIVQKLSDQALMNFCFPNGFKRFLSGGEMIGSRKWYLKILNIFWIFLKI
ncbi:hypothetical protein F7H86_13405 [Novacetimonas hansenii]